MKKIAVIGTGYVGLVSGAGLSEFGHEVNCIDIDDNKINNLNAGEIPIYEPGLKSLVTRNVDDNRLLFSSNIEEVISNSEIIFIAVGTPQGSDGRANISAVEAVIDTIIDNLKL